MYLPKQLWPSQARKKLQTLGATALVGASLIGCSAAPTDTANVVETAVSIPTTLATSIPLGTDIASSLVPATFTPLPTTLPAETAVSLPPIPSTTAPISAGRYVDGDYLGDSVRTDRWGNTQVIAHVEGGVLVDVEISQYPNSSNRSSQISWSAFPALISEAIQNQDADVNIVTRATDTSVAFIQSLESALDDAAVGAS